MPEQWSRVRRLDGGRLANRSVACSDVSVEFVRQLPGGAVGAAALVRLPSGELAVLSSWPPGSAARAGEVSDLLDRLRVRGYPAPAYLAVVDCGDIVAVVTTQPDRPGQYHYAWISGPNPDYGFSSASSDGRPSTMVDHEEAIRNFLSLVDPETGYID